MKPHAFCLFLFSITICLHANDPLEDLDAAQQALGDQIAKFEETKTKMWGYLDVLAEESKEIVKEVLNAPEGDLDSEFCNNFFIRLEVFAARFDSHHRLTHGKDTESCTTYVRFLLRRERPSLLLTLSREALAEALHPLIQSLVNAATSRDASPIYRQFIALCALLDNNIQIEEETTTEDRSSSSEEDTDEATLERPANTTLDEEKTGYRSSPFPSNAEYKETMLRARELHRYAPSPYGNAAWMAYAFDEY